MSETDRLERIGQSTVQHGKHSDRVYLMHLDPADAQQVLDWIDRTASRENYSKVFAKVPAQTASGFLSRGYDVEARVPGFFGGGEEGLFLAKFLDPARREAPNRAQLDEVTDQAQARAPKMEAPELEDGLTLRALGSQDAEALAGLYRQVFESYPFPIHEPEYLREVMDSHVAFFGVFENGELIAAASAEMDEAAGHVEMTDFATRPDQRGRGLARALLWAMEEAMAERGLQCFYTIARAVSKGMNFVFADAGYRFGGQLVNNTQISGGMESMNVWYKPAGKTVG